MKLSQRLIRAGLAFVILGSVTAALPGEFRSAQATTAAGTGTGGDGYSSVALTDNPSLPDDSSIDVTTGNNVTLYTLSQPTGSGSYGRDPGVTLTSSNPSVVYFGTAGNATTTTDSNGQAVATTTNAGSSNITATFPGGEMVVFTINVNPSGISSQ